MSKEERIVKIISKIEHSIFDKTYTYFACPDKDDILENQMINEDQEGCAMRFDNETDQNMIDENQSNKKVDLEKLKDASDQDSLEECLVIIFYFLYESINFYIICVFKTNEIF